MPVCAILGVGPGNGMAIARRFDAADHALALCARRGAEMEAAARGFATARGYACDVTDPASLTAAAAAIARDLGPVDTLVYNAGSGTWGNLANSMVRLRLTKLLGHANTHIVTRA